MLNQRERPVYVVGHQCPDTDSAVSAVVYAQWLNAKGNGKRYAGIVLGELTSQTKWLFERAQTPLPALVPELRLSAADIAHRDVWTVDEQASLGDAMRILRQQHVNVLPVVNHDKQLVGVLSDRLPNFTYFSHFNMEDFMGILFELSDLVHGLGLTCWNPVSKEANGRLTLEREDLKSGDVLLTGDNPDDLAAAAKRNASAVIVCTRRRRSQWNKALSRGSDVGVYQFNGSLMALTSQLPHSIPIRNVMSSDYPESAPNDDIDEIKNKLHKTICAVPVVGPKKELLGVVSSTEILNAPRLKVILVDHFEQHQMGKGIEKAEILEIIDHHRVGTLETDSPIRVDCRPLGSTATILASRMEEENWRPTDSQALLLLGAIVADTLLLTSPTTTGIDRTQAVRLAEIAGVNLEEFGKSVLTHNDELLSKSPGDLLEKDLKEFQSGQVRFGIAQVETTDRTRLSDSMIAEFKRCLNVRRCKAGWDFLALMITDIFRGDGLVMMDDANKSRCERLLQNGQAAASLWPGCVSRKKQFLPTLLGRLRAHRG